MRKLSLLLAAVLAVTTTFSAFAEGTVDAPVYTTDYNSMAEAQKAAETLTAEIAAEGSTLLKNENKALPLASNAWISVFGVTEQGM